MKITSIFVLALSMTMVFAGERWKESKWSNAFETDSEFMKGFETGIFLRTKGGKVEEYGCKEAEISDNTVISTIETIRMAISNAKSALPDEEMLQDALDMIFEFLGSLKYFVTVLSPKFDQEVDMYCTGLVFGNQGSKMLVRFANIIVNPVGEDGQIIPTNISAEERKRRKSKKKGGEMDVLKAAGNFFKKLGEQALGKMTDPSDEL